MKATSTRTYAGESGEARRLRRRNSFIAAALAVSDTVGWRQLTVDRLTKEAGLSKRYFYDLFADIDELGGAVVDHIADGLTEVVATTLSDERDGSVPQLAHATIASVVSYVTADPRRARLLFGELSSTDSVARHRSTAIRRISAQVVRMAREIHQADDVQHTIIATSAALLIGGTGQAILAWIDGTLPSTVDELVDDLTALWLITGDGTADYVRAHAST